MILKQPLFTEEEQKDAEIVLLHLEQRVQEAIEQEPERKEEILQIARRMAELCIETLALEKRKRICVRAIMIGVIGVLIILVAVAVNTRQLAGLGVAVALVGFVTALLNAPVKFLHRDLLRKSS